MPVDEVRFRLLRADDRPASNPDGRAFVFGLQDTEGEIVAGTRGADGGFVCLARRAAAGDYINRVKARLGGIDWPLLEAAERSGGRLIADLTGWLPGDSRRFVTWRVGSERP